MFKNNLGVALRSVLKHKLFSFINVFGLALGLASVILIGLYVADELSYDRYHENADRLYRISRDFYAYDSVDELRFAANAAPVAPVLQLAFPEIENVARLSGGRVLLSRDEVAFYDDAVQFVDPSFLQMFTFEWLEGDSSSSLEKLNGIVLTESLARKFFGRTDVRGEMMKLENLMPIEVTGVIRDLLDNTHLEANAFMQIEPLFRFMGERSRSDWNNTSYHTYIKLASGASIESVAQGFPGFIDRTIDEGASKWTGFSTMAVADIHLHSSRLSELRPAGSFATVITLITVAIGILAIACFNFMNLATALSGLRGKEVGVRKSIGARRPQLVLQFLGEAMGMTLVATVLAIVVVETIMPTFNAFTGKALSFDVMSNIAVQGSLILLVLVVGCAAGAYPALHLSAFNPTQVLKSQRDVTSRGRFLFRNVLVIAQFGISIILVIVTAVVFLQTNYARQFDHGFEREQVVTLGGSPTQGVTQRWETLKKQLLQHPEIVSATASNVAPGNENLNSLMLRMHGSDAVRSIPPLFVDYDFFETLQIDLLSGRLFSENFPADRISVPNESSPISSGNFILNASAARDLGWNPKDIIDREISISTGGSSVLSGRVIGVVADSNFESARFHTKPIVFILTPPGMWFNQFQTLGTASVRISGKNLDETLAYIDNTWKSVIP